MMTIIPLLWLMAMVSLSQGFKPLIPRRSFTALKVSIRPDATASSDLKTALNYVREAAMQFPKGSESQQQALKIVDALAQSSFDSWKRHQLELIDGCLIDDNEACENFHDKMLALRQLWEAPEGGQ